MKDGTKEEYELLHELEHALPSADRRPGAGLIAESVTRDAGGLPHYTPPSPWFLSFFNTRRATGCEDTRYAEWTGRTTRLGILASLWPASIFGPCTQEP